MPEKPMKVPASSGPAKETDPLLPEVTFAPDEPTQIIPSESDLIELDGERKNPSKRTLLGSRSYKTVADANPDLPKIGSSKSFRGNLLTIFHRFKGILAMLFATLMVALNPQILFYVREILGRNYSKECYLFWSNLFYSIMNGIPLIIIYIINPDSICNPLRENKKTWLLLLGRGSCGCLILFTMWHAISLLGRPAPAAVVNAMAPILVYINAFFFLHEQIGVVPILNAFVAMGGVAIMNYEELKKLSNPNSTTPINSTNSTGNSTSSGHHDARNPLLGTLVAMCSMYLLSWALVFVRMLKNVHSILVNLSYGVCGVIILGMVASINGTLMPFKLDNGHDDWLVWLLCVTTATNATISNLFFNYALKYEQAGICSLARTSEVLFQFVYQFIFFGYSPDMYTGIGASLVIFGVVCVSLRKIVIESEEDSRIRHYLYYLKY